MEWIEILKKLDFSLWQLFWIFLFFAFRKEIKGIIYRTQSLKIGNQEIKLSSADLVSELRKIREEIYYDLNKGETSKALERIDEFMKHKLTGALINIKNNTNVLWKKLSSTNREPSFVADVRSISYDRIIESMLVLRSAKILDFVEEKTFQYAEGGPVYEIHVFKISKEIDELVELAKKF